MEDYTRAQELITSIEFFKKILETHRLEELKKRHEVSLQVSKNQSLKEKKSIEEQFKQEIKERQEEHKRELDKLAVEQKKQKREVLREHMSAPVLNLRMVPEIAEMEMTLKKLVKEKKYADVKYLKRLKEQKERQLIEESQHKAKETLRNKLTALKTKQASEIGAFKIRLEEFMSEKKVHEEKSLAKHRKSSKVRLLNTCSSNIKEFNQIDKKVRNITLDNKKPLESKYKYYGNDIKTRSLLKSKQIRNTFVVDLLKNAN